MNLLLTGLLLSILYGHNMPGFSGLVGADFLVLSIIGLPSTLHLVRMDQIKWLNWQFAIAVLATLIAASSYSIAIYAYIKTLVIYASALSTSYITFLYVSSLDRRTISSHCLVLTLILLVCGWAEVTLPAVRQSFEQISAFQYVSGKTQAAGEDFLQRQFERDMEMHGARIRPICGSVEPSRVAFMIGILLSGWNLTRQRSQIGDFSFLVLTVFAILLTRSPTLAIALAAGTIRPMASSLKSGWMMILAVIAISISIYVGSLALGERAQKVMNDEDSSTGERIKLPISLSYVVLRDRIGMGLGFTGPLADPKTHILDPFFGFVTEAAEISNTYGLIVAYHRLGTSIPCQHMALMTHWIYHGILLGLLSVWVLYHYAYSLEPGEAGWLLWIMLILGVSGWTYENLPFWNSSLMLFAFISSSVRSENPDESGHIEYQEF